MEACHHLVSEPRLGQGHWRKLFHVHAWPDMPICIQCSLLHYCPADLSLIWLKQGHSRCLAQTCRHPPSGTPEPQSVTATNCYCSTVQPWAVSTTSSGNQPLLQQPAPPLKASMCPVFSCCATLTCTLLWWHRKIEAARSSGADISVSFEPVRTPRGLRCRNQQQNRVRLAAFIKMHKQKAHRRQMKAGRGQ